MVRISKVLLLSLLVVAFASSAFATTTRVQSLAETSNYINDDSNIFRWYGTLPSYTNMVMAEFGQEASSGGNSEIDIQYQALGFTHNWGEDHWLGTWAIFLLNNNVTDMSFFLFNPLKTFEGGDTGLDVPTTKFVLAWGNEIDKISWGINFTRSESSFESENTNPAVGGQQNLNFTTFGGGVRVELGESTYGDASITYGKAGGDTLGGFDKGSGLDLAARIFYEWREDVTFIGYGDFSTAEYSFSIDPNDVTGPGSNGDKESNIEFGAALNFDVNTSNMLIFATEIGFAKWEYSNVATNDATEEKTTTLPRFRIALESDINSWLTTRVGATKTMEKFEETFANGDKDTDTGPSSPGDDFSWFLGAGFHLGDWDIDALVHEETPFRLGYWLTGFGADDSDAPVTRISGTYRF